MNSTDNENYLTILHLPEETILKIFDYVEYLTLFNLRLVSKECNRIASDSNLYAEFYYSFRNLHPYRKFSISEQYRYYEIMGRALNVPNSRCKVDNEITNQQNSQLIKYGNHTNEFIENFLSCVKNKDTSIETIHMFLISDIPINLIFYRCCIILIKNGSVEKLRLIKSFLGYPPSTCLLESIFSNALENRSLSLEMCKFLLEELNCPICLKRLNEPRFYFDSRIHEYISSYRKEAKF